MSLFHLLAAPRAESLSLTSAHGWDSIMASWGRKSKAGETVTEAAALTLSTCFACLNVLGGDIAKIPRKVFKRRPTRGRDLAADHPVHDLVHTEPNEEATASTFWGSLAVNGAFWGNGYAEIERARNGRPIGLWLIHPTRVRPKRDSQGDLYYEVRRGAGQTVVVNLRDMLHLPGIGSDGLQGWNVFRTAIDILGLGLAQVAYASSYIGSGSAPSGVLEYPKKLDDPGRERLKESWRKSYGGPDNAGAVVVLEEGLKYAAIGVKPSDAQLTEAQKMIVADVCRFFRVSPGKVFDREQAQGWSTLDAQQTDHIEETLMPWLVRIEQECDRKLFTPDERGQGYYVRHIVQALLRGDMKSRATFYRMLQMVGALSPNEIRELEDMNPIGSEGDVHLLPLQLAPVGDVADGSARKQSAGSSGGAGGPDARWAMAPVIEDTARRMLRIEADRVTRLAAKHKEGGLIGFADALAGFHATHRGAIMRALMPIVHGLKVAGARDRIDALAGRFVASSGELYCVAFLDGKIKEVGAELLEHGPVEWRDAIVQALAPESKETADAPPE